MRLTKEGAKLGYTCVQQIYREISQQHRVWSEICTQKQDFGVLAPPALLAAELSGLIYIHVGYDNRMIDVFEVLGNVFSFIRSSSSTSDRPFWALLMNQTNGQLSLVFRGTDNVIDILTDSNAQLCNINLKNLAFRAHSGCCEVVGDKTAILRDLIYKCYADSGNQISITITGHSLGGGYALLFYLYLLGDGVINPEHIVCYTFGAPAVVAPPNSLTDPKQFKGWLGVMGRHAHRVHNFINRFDIVPRLLGNSAAVRLFEALVGLKGTSSAALRQYRETASNNDILFNTDHYQPYGNFYWLYHTKKTLCLLKAETQYENRVFMTMPVFIQ